jgi:ribosomal protein S27E
LDGKCRYCRAPLPSLPAQFLPLPMRFTSAVELESEIASALPAGLGRLLMLQCPRCGHRDFEAKSFNRGPYQVRCRQCGSAVSL